MKYLLTIAALLLLHAGFAQVPANTLSAKEKKAGWKLLFDGKTTKGWHCYGKTTVGSSWKTEDGVLSLDTSNKTNGKIADGGNLLTDEAYENFHLKLEWKISPGGNSGILIYVEDDAVKYKEPYMTGRKCRCWIMMAILMENFSATGRGICMTWSTAVKKQ
jgi:hypothetical protein